MLSPTSIYFYLYLNLSARKNTTKKKALDKNNAVIITEIMCLQKQMPLFIKSQRMMRQDEQGREKAKGPFGCYQGISFIREHLFLSKSPSLG